jgi:chondroitin synthase
VKCRTPEDRLQCLRHYEQLTRRKSEDAAVKSVVPIPADWPKDLVLAPLPESTNDFRWNAQRRHRLGRPSEMAPTGLSVIVSAFGYLE